MKLGAGESGVAEQMKGDEEDVSSMLTILDRPLLSRSFGAFEIDIGMQLGSEQEDKL